MVVVQALIRTQISNKDFRSKSFTFEDLVQHNFSHLLPISCPCVRLIMEYSQINFFCTFLYKFTLFYYINIIMEYYINENWIYDTFRYSVRVFNWPMWEATEINVSKVISKTVKSSWKLCGWKEDCIALIVQVKQNLSTLEGSIQILRFLSEFRHRTLSLIGERIYISR